MIFKKENVALWACILPFQAGLIAMMSVLHFALMATNIAGHFPRAIRELLTQNTETGSAILFNILIYFITAILTGYWVNRFSRHRGLMHVPLVATLLALLIIAFAPVPDYIKLNLLFFSMSNQNVFSAFITEGVVKPSQLTGIALELAQNIAKYFLKMNRSVAATKAQLTVITCFVLSLILAIWINELHKMALEYIVIGIQSVILFLYYFKTRQV